MRRNPRSAGGNKKGETPLKVHFLAIVVLLTACHERPQTTLGSRMCVERSSIVRVELTRCMAFAGDADWYYLTLDQYGSTRIPAMGVTALGGDFGVPSVGSPDQYEIAPDHVVGGYGIGMPGP